jgi:hypothetical protein
LLDLALQLIEVLLRIGIDCNGSYTVVLPELPKSIAIDQDTSVFGAIIMKNARHGKSFCTGSGHQSQFVSGL